MGIKALQALRAWAFKGVKANIKFLSEGVQANTKFPSEGVKTDTKFLQNFRISAVAFHVCSLEDL